MREIERQIFHRPCFALPILSLFLHFARKRHGVKDSKRMASPTERSSLTASTSLEKKFYFLPSADTPSGNTSRNNSIVNNRQRHLSKDGKELELPAPSLLQKTGSSHVISGDRLGAGGYNSEDSNGALDSLGGMGMGGEGGSGGRPSTSSIPSSWFNEIGSNVSSMVHNLLGRRSDHAYQTIGGVVAMQQKPRKMPIKVEPKVFFANERTFLAWLHMSVTLASISVAIVAFAEANEWSQIYGLLLLPVAIAFCVYSLWMYVKRSNMIRRKDPGPYEDRVGPVVLATMLTFAILVNFFVKLYSMSTGKV